MKIGEVSASSGCHIETIRYYERIGLMTAPDRTASGYRQYRDADIDRLRFIAYFADRDRAFRLIVTDVGGVVVRGV